MTSILGISAFYHDSAAALIIDGKIIAAAQEERFSRKKHDPAFPYNAINFVLNEENISEDISKNSGFKIIFNEAENKVEVEDFYMQLLLSFNDKLSEIPHEIEAIQIDGVNYYRLVLKGLENKSIAKELRSFFLKNGIDSEISIK